MASTTTTGNTHALSGSCSCGRNHYIVQIPAESRHEAHVIFDNSRNHRRSQATPLSAWLRVPLTWYQSTTQAFMDDESHSAIRRVYTSPHEQHSKRHFCGYCGTPLSFWSEESPEEAEYICLTLGSLGGADLRDLDDLGLLPAELREGEEEGRAVVQQVRDKGQLNEGLPWFDSMVEGSQLGRMRKSWGKRNAGDGRYTIEWEVMEWTEGDGDGAPMTPGKRKIGEVLEDDKMQH